MCRGVRGERQVCRGKKKMQGEENVCRRKRERCARGKERCVELARPVDFSTLFLLSLFFKETEYFV